MRAIGPGRAGGDAGGVHVAHARVQRQRRRARRAATTPPAAVMPSAWPTRPKPVTSVIACTRGSIAVAVCAGAAVEARQHLERRPRAGLVDGALAQPVDDQARAERLGEHERVAGARADVARDARRIDDAGDRQAVEELLAAHGVPAGDDGAGLGDLVLPAGEDLARLLGLERLREHAQRQRRQRPPAHRVHVAERVGRGDLPVEPRIVRRRRDEVGGHHERLAIAQTIHAGVVGRLRADQQLPMGGRLQLPHDRS